MYRLLLISLGVMLMFPFFSVTAVSYIDDISEMPSSYITVVDEKNAVILQTGLEIRPGDEYITESNHRYEITAIEGALAKAHYIHNESMFPYDSETVPVQAPGAAQQQLIAIYHTHTDECYIPDDGQPAIPGKGSIALVGDAFTNRLNALGYQTEHDKTLHDPHDANAYQRSRRTFMKLLGHKPAAFFDIHRDSAPPEMYQYSANGQELTKILLVVGRQNQNRNTTLDYAKGIKAAADAKHKGLIRGIFIAHGNYNQDLNPRSMLVEIGTQYNSRIAAEHSAALFADLVPSFLPPNAPAPPPVSAFDDTTSQNPIIENIDTAPPPTSSPYVKYTSDALVVISALIIGIIAYLYLSTGSWHEAKRKLDQFRKYEFTNFLGWCKRRRR